MIFNTIWDEFEKELTLFVRSKLYDKSLTADVMQEIAIKLYKNQDMISDVENKRAWLYRLSKNTLIDFYKKNFKKIPDDLLINNIEKYTTDPDIQELSSCLVNMLDELKQSDKDILKLKELDELSINEISSAMKLSIDGSKSKIKRARKKLSSVFFSCCSLETNSRGQIIDFKQNSSNCSC